MNNFIKKTFIWLVIVLSISIVIFSIEYNVSIKTHVNHPNLKKSDNNIFLLADSHGFGINTDSFGVSNLSNYSESYVDMESMLYFLINNRKINRIILSYDEHLFNTYRDEINNNYKSTWLKSFSIFYTVKYIFKYNETYISLFQNQITRTLEKLFFGKKEIEKDFISYSNDIKTKKVKNRIKEQYTGISKHQIQSFNKIIKLCNEKNIQIDLIRFPLPKIYLEERKKNQIYLDLKIPKVKDVNIIDLSESIQEIEFYKDQDHLNEEGLKLLEKLIASSIDKP